MRERTIDPFDGRSPRSGAMFDERSCELGGRRPTRVAIAKQTARNDRRKSRRDVRNANLERERTAFEDRGDDPRDGSLERRRAREQLVENDAERPEIGSRIDALVPQLLR